MVGALGGLDGVLGGLTKALVGLLEALGCLAEALGGLAEALGGMAEAGLGGRDKRTDERRYGWNFFLYYRTWSPAEAAAQKLDAFKI